MGFLREKVVRGVTYFLWCERKRDGKKRGGSGKVKSREFTLGKHPYLGEWISAYAFLGYLPIEQFLEKIAAREFDREIRFWGSFSVDPSSEDISFNLNFYGDSKPPTISMRAKRGIDLRKKNWRLAREEINDSLNCAWRHCYDFPEKIKWAKSDLESAKRSDSRSQEARKEINDPYDENVRDSYELWLDMANKDYLRVKASIDDLLKRTPKKYQDEMIGKLERMIYQK